MPLISVIVPVFKVEPYLRECVDSILCQTFTDFELILVDDGSPDNCPAICDEYAKKDNRVVVIHKSNGGLSSARNAGIEIAIGRFLSFVDGDDYVFPTFLEHLYNKLISTNSDLAICNFCRLEKTRVIEPKKRNESDFDISVYDFDSASRIVAWNKLYKIELFENIRYPIGKIHEDEFVIHRIIAKCNRICYIDEALYCYRQNCLSIMNTEKKKDRVLCSIDYLTDRVRFFYFEFKNDKLANKYYHILLEKLIENYRVLSNTNIYKHSFRVMKRIYKLRNKNRNESLFFFSPFFHKIIMKIKKAQHD